MTIQVNFVLHGDVPESGTMTSCLVQEPVNLKTIRNVFPFEGHFHFRVKHTNIVPGSNYVWVDLTRDGEEIRATNDIIDIQALVISLPDMDEYEGNGTNEYMQEVQHILTEAILDDSNRPDRQSIKGEKIAAGIDPITLAANTALDLAKGLGIQTMSLNSVAKNAASLWSSVRSTASSFGIQLTTPVDNLNKLHMHLTTTFDDSVPKHVALLEQVWSALFPGYPFERESPKWREAGWQKPNPVADLKTSGLLALRCVRYLGQSYGADTLRMVSSQRENIKSHYPFAVVGVNLTLMLAEVIGFRDKRYMDRQVSAAGYYEMFEDKAAFYEVFCICFLYLDAVWNQRGCIRADFGPLMGEVKAAVVKVMDKYPQNLDQFRALAAESGLMPTY